MDASRKMGYMLMLRVRKQEDNRRFQFFRGNEGNGELMLRVLTFPHLLSEVLLNKNTLLTQYGQQLPLLPYCTFPPMFIHFQHQRDDFIRQFALLT